MGETVSRREFLRRAALLGAASCAGLSGCGRSDRGEPGLAERIRALDPDLICSDTTGLWPAEIETRTDNDYVQRSSRPDQFCFNCSNFIPPEEEGTCGACKTVKGPINPGGWCKAWTEART